MIKFFLVFNMHFLTFFLLFVFVSFLLSGMKTIMISGKWSHVLSYYIFHNIFINSVSAEFEKIKGEQLVLYINSCRLPFENLQRLVHALNLKYVCVSNHEVSLLGRSRV